MSKKTQLALKVALEMVAAVADQIIEDQQALTMLQLILVGIELLVHIVADLTDSSSANSSEDAPGRVQDSLDDGEHDPDDQPGAPGAEDPAEPTQ